MLILKENAARQLDSLGRITIPKAMRDRLGFTENQKYEIYTIEHEGKTFVAIAKEDNSSK